MIPEHLRQSLGAKLYEQIGNREDVGQFVFTFAALPIGHDLEYALEELKKGDDEYKKAVNIVLEAIAS